MRWWGGQIGPGMMKGVRGWRVKTAIDGAVAIYAVGLAALTLLVWLGGDRWWFMTPVIYGPAWVFAVPLVLLAPPAVWGRRWWACGAGGVCVVMVGYLMGFHVSLPRGMPALGERAWLRVVTCNADGQLGAADGLFTYMAKRDVDLLAVEECPRDLPEVMKQLPEWHVVSKWDGLCVASRYPIREWAAFKDPNGWRDVMLRCDVETEQGLVHVFCVHLDTPRNDLGSFFWRNWRHMGPEMTEAMESRRRQAEAVRKEIDRFTGPRIVLGDFNLVEQSSIYRECFGDYTDAFAARGLGVGHTKMLRKWGVRIDHILSAGGVYPRWCEVGPDVGSDHVPFMAVLGVSGGGGAVARAE